MFNKKLIFLLTGIFLTITTIHGQSVDSVTNRIVNFPSRFFSRIQGKTANLDQQLTKQTEKYLRKMAKEEQRLKKKLYKIDSSAAKNLFSNSTQQYAALAQKLKTDTGHNIVPLRGPYMPYIDSLKTSLAFLQKNPQLVSASNATQQSLQNSAGQIQQVQASLQINTQIAGSSITSSSNAIQQKIQSSMGQFQQLQAKMQDADLVKQYIQQRKEQIRQYLQHYTQVPSGITSSFNNYKKQAYYYSQTVQSYKEELNDPDKMLKTGLQLLNKVPAFTSFVKQNSMLASLANVPSTSGPSAASQGMATRDQVMSSIQGAAGTNGPNITAALQQNVQSGQSQIDQLRDKLVGSGGNGADLAVPDFKTNDQKTKSIFSRLQFGVNLQSTHGNLYYPTTTDIGASLGFKIDSKNVVGIGASFKVGWGNDFQHIQVSAQGVGLRSFADFHLKNSLYISGGFEYNYQQPFSLQGIPNNLSGWQKSGLIGLSKVISMKTRVFKNTKIQLLWDFLSYQQTPPGQPLKFRVGYSF